MDNELTAFQWPRPGGSVTGDLQQKKGRGAGRKVQAVRYSPSTYRFADATTLRESLQVASFSRILATSAQVSENASGGCRVD
jgi:hypothetical protein